MTKALARGRRPPTAASKGALVLRESDIARTCSDLLQADGWRMVITDPVSDKSRGKGFGELGMADRLYIRYASMPTILPASAQPCLPPLGDPDCPPSNRSIWADEVMWIEWKRTVRGRATKPTQHQLDWHRDERARGALTLIAGEDFPATIEGFCAWYNASGLQRNGARR